MNDWAVVLAVGVGTYLLRATLFVVIGTRPLPGWTERPLALVAPAGIAALVATMVLTDHGRLAPAGIAPLAAVAASFLAVRASGSVARGLVVGFPVLWALSAVGL